MKFLMKFLTYLVPLLLNFIYGGMFFITAYRFTAANAPEIVVGATIAGWGVVYCLVSAVVGGKVNNCNCRSFMVCGSAVLIVANGCLRFIPGLYQQFIGIGLVALGGAMICAPFQLFAKNFEESSSASSAKNGAVRAASFYTASWSVGFALGAWIFGKLVPETGFNITLVTSILIAGCFAVVILASRRTRNAVAVPVPGGQSASIPDDSCRPANFPAYVGWIAGGVGTFAVCQIRAMWPVLGHSLNFSKYDIAVVLTIVSLAQAVSALILCLSKNWMYKWLPGLVMGLSGCFAMGCFVFGRSLNVFLLAALIYGLFSGASYFFLVFHSLAHPTRSAFFVAGNEVIVGIINIAAPLLGGWLANCGMVMPFVAGGLLLLTGTLIHSFLCFRCR